MRFVGPVGSLEEESGWVENAKARGFANTNSFPWGDRPRMGSDLRQRAAALRRQFQKMTMGEARLQPAVDDCSLASEWEMTGVFATMTWDIVSCSYAPVVTTGEGAKGPFFEVHSWGRRKGDETGVRRFTLHGGWKLGFREVMGHWMTGVLAEAEAEADGKHVAWYRGPNRAPCRPGRIAHISEGSEELEHVRGSAG